MTELNRWHLANYAQGSEHNDTKFRLGITATASYIPDAEPNPAWCVEVGFAGDEPAVQGWGPDPLAAALDAAGNAYMATARLREHMAGEHPAELGPLSCPVCEERFHALLRDAQVPS